jgi:hypothetical protein
MDFMNFITEKGLIIIPVLYIIGAIIKNTNFIPNKFIPIILLALGITFTGATIGWTANGIIQGVLVAGATVLGNQLYKQAKSGDIKDIDTDSENQGE